MVDQNLLEGVWKSLSMASLNSSWARVSASATAKATPHLACQYLPAASRVPQARQAQATLSPQLWWATLTMEERNNVPRLTQAMVEAPSDRGLCRALPADPHNREMNVISLLRDEILKDLNSNTTLH